MSVYDLVINRESQRSLLLYIFIPERKIISQNTDKSAKCFSDKTCNYTFGTGKQMIQFAKITAIRMTEIE